VGFATGLELGARVRRAAPLLALLLIGAPAPAGAGALQGPGGLALSGGAGRFRLEAPGGEGRAIELPGGGHPEVLVETSDGWVAAGTVVRPEGADLYLWRKRKRGLRKPKGTVILVHGSSMASTPSFDLQVKGEADSSLMDYLAKRGVGIPRRTDCARCYGQRLIEWYRLWRDYPDIYADAERQEEQTGHTFRSPGRDTWPAPLAELRTKHFERGHAPLGALDDKQGRLFLDAADACRVCRL